MRLISSLSREVIPERSQGGREAERPGVWGASAGATPDWLREFRQGQREIAKWSCRQTGGDPGGGA